MENLKRVRRDGIQLLEDGYFQAAFTNEPKECYAVVKGPKDTPYEGGNFLVRLEYPNEYPFKGISAQFLSKIYHPNISSQTGAVCLDVLGKNWSPAMTPRLVLHSLETMLDTPVPDDPMDAVVAQLCLNDPEAFFAKARDWTRRYGHGDEQIHKYKQSEAWINLG